MLSLLIPPILYLNLKPFYVNETGSTFYSIIKRLLDEHIATNSRARLEFRKKLRSLKFWAMFGNPVPMSVKKVVKIKQFYVPQHVT
jgi:hypothetical protein